MSSAYLHAVEVCFNGKIYRLAKSLHHVGSSSWEAREEAFRLLQTPLRTTESEAVLSEDDRYLAWDVQVSITAVWSCDFQASA
ncbi:uncharacterized protein RSE6_03751 [Rhynchosporium secalis]|uniref:Uncharacterized protein n=1 Tax=Rhynchosporium secalis TaxID=38038 RepID=A0A1E1M3K1_RHYSE|nr:uncharacterized protein RSE6_03751 [Rhynchosporium secalis]